VSGVIDFLTDVGWIKQDKSGLYQVARNGRTNTIKRERQIIRFGLPSNQGFY
jgi:hypothetical protein